MATPIYGFETILEGQLNAEVFINTNTLMMEMLWNWNALGFDNDPPGSPSEGDLYIVNDTPTGAWVGHEMELAGWYNAAWVFVAPTHGMFKNVDDENQWRWYNTGTPGTWDVLGTEANTPWD